MRLSKRTWQAIALVLILIAVFLGALGLFMAFTPDRPLESWPEKMTDYFGTSRACCLAPAFVLLCLAYLIAAVGRRQDPRLRWSELLATLGAAAGLLLALVGLTAIIAPGPDDPARTQAGMAAMCLLPGLFIVAVSGVFWFWSRGRG
ncbi:MAG: hypothetical protein JW850_05070 [Thermoflexales bacterium]|nr:hypothetical protein [Thermoflexales bacterium]